MSRSATGPAPLRQRSVRGPFLFLLQHPHRQAPGTVCTAGVTADRLRSTTNRRRLAAVLETAAATAAAAAALLPKIPPAMRSSSFCSVHGTHNSPPGLNPGYVFRRVCPMCHASDVEALRLFHAAWGLTSWKPSDPHHSAGQRGMHAMGNRCVASRRVIRRTAPLPRAALTCCSPSRRTKTSRHTASLTPAFQFHAAGMATALSRVGQDESTA